MTWSFDDWLRWAFDHPLPSSADKAWYFAPDAEMWDAEADPVTAVAYIARLFGAPELLIGRFSPDQIGQGLWLLADPSCSSHMFALIDPAVPWPARKNAIDAIFNLYDRLLRRICLQRMNHLDRSAGPGSLADRICFMFWDVCPLGPRGSSAHEHDLACLAAMRRTLTIPHLACQEGALHGLAHWSAAYPDQVDEIITGFLAAADPATPSELRDFARQSGCRR